MAITVEEALTLDIFKGFKVIAGKKGLLNEITRVSVWDYELGEEISQNFSPHEFALSTLIAIKDDVNDLYSVVERMIKIGICGLAIKKVYFDHIPDNVIELANKCNFPIMMFKNTYTEDIIVAVNKAIDQKKEYENLALQIDHILYNNLNEDSIRKIARKINVNFREKNIVVFCKRKVKKSLMTKSFYEKEMEEAFCKVIPYKNGYVLINTFEDAKSSDIYKVVLRKLKWWGFVQDKYIIGLSDLHEELGSLNIAIQESIYAFEYSATYKKDISFFHDIGINRVVLPTLDNPWVQKYYSDMIKPIIEYDKENETELLDTAVRYVENNGNIKETAAELFQHSNTIRYRIDRVKEIMSRNCKTKHFYEELSVAVRIYNLMNI